MSVAPEHPGKLVSRLIAARKLSVKVAATRIGIHRSHLSAIVHGKMRLTPRVARQIATRLSLEPDEIVKLYAAQGRFDLYLLDRDPDRRGVR